MKKCSVENVLCADNLYLLFRGTTIFKQIFISLQISTQDIFANNPCAMSSPEADSGLKDPERAELIAELARRVDIGRFNTSAWLFLWFSDLTTLHEIVNSASSPSFCAVASCTLGWDSKAMDQFLQACEFSVIDRERWRSIYTDNLFLYRACWIGHIRKPHLCQNVCPNKQCHGFSNRRRSYLIGELFFYPFFLQNTDSSQCMDRDSVQCVVTKCSDLVEVCHIVPFLFIKNEQTWRRLRLFWPQEQVDTWKNFFGGQDYRTEFLRNSICLTSYVRDMWQNGLCTFKPVEKRNGEGDEEYLTLEFYYLPPPIPMNSVRVSVGTRPLIPSNLTKSPGNLAVVNYEKGVFLVSGDKFTLRTHNKHTHPLPSWELLMMQWNIQRIAGLRGAAELFDDDEEDESDGGDKYDRYIPEVENDL